MKVTTGVSLLAIIAFISTLSRVCNSACVLESDFGLLINCAFKKSSLFRIRNLGGVKAHISWGLTVGDDYGFKESLLNTQLNRRRATSLSKAQIELITAQQEDQKKKTLRYAVPENYSNTTGNSSATFSSDNLNNAPVKPMSPIPSLKQIFSPSQTSNDTSSKDLSRENEINDSMEKETDSNDNRSSQEVISASIERLSKIIENIYFNINDAEPSEITVAPKKYHPSGYAKAIEEPVSKKIRLPKTSFVCRDQKYFPGFYADEDLGCSIFHVCAMMNNGELRSRSFLCPESTLFDQSMLKCNWWFYVDCTQSKRHYDVNLPVARGYQIMKALSEASSRVKSNEAIDYLDNQSSTINPRKQM